ncbi:hypothetical protein [Henriciella sp.]|uniref:hypothetical protein n=1 Tax=Henriciella sp. TaxID=1968823 RepID=UPI002635B94F|nr:hypothetical protein [Henriciella sp.]
MAEETKPVDFCRLRTLMLIAVMAGGGVLVIFLWRLGQFDDFDIGWSVMAFAFGAIVWSAVFYFGCLALEGSLTSYIVSDNTEIKGDNVKLVTKTRSSGDPRLDAWIEKFVFARNTFGMSVIPVLIFVGLYFWY